MGWGGEADETIGGLLIRRRQWGKGGGDARDGDGSGGNSPMSVITGGDEGIDAGDEEGNHEGGGSGEDAAGGESEGGVDGYACCWVGEDSLSGAWPVPRISGCPIA